MKKYSYPLPQEKVNGKIIPREAHESGSMYWERVKKLAQLAQKELKESEAKI